MADYTYDAFHRRITKTITTTPLPLTTIYVYDGARVVQEYEDTDGLGTGTAPKLQRGFIYGNYIDEVLVMIDGDTGGSPEFYYYVRNRQYHVVGLVQPDGTIAVRYEHDSPFGLYSVFNGAGTPLGMLHIRRGGSNGTTKDKDDRFVPIHPRTRPLLDAVPRTDRVVSPGAEITERRLLKRVKSVCHEIGLSDPDQYKLHSFRHHFASLCANHQVAYRKALAWLGHSSSQILDLYYHLHDAGSQSAMKSLAADGFNDGQETSGTPGSEGTLRAIWGPTNEKRPEDLWEQELLSVLGEKAERVGFEPAEQGIPRSTV